MMKYRRKPEEVEAVLFDGNNFDEIGRFVGFEGSVTGRKKTLGIKTFEGVKEVEPGDYIVKNNRDQLYPCKPDIFEALYEKVE